MRVLGVKFPVYLLVTKCDLVQGMTKFSERLPEKASRAAHGLHQSGPLKGRYRSFWTTAIKTIGERLRMLRILLLHHPQSKSVDPALLLFPEEFEQLRRGLEPFMKSAFQENPYQETPILRGLFFTTRKMRSEGAYPSIRPSFPFW